MRRALVFLVIGLLTGGCTLGEILARYRGVPADLSETALVGTWTSGDRSITFVADGGFTAVRLPSSLLDNVQPSISPTGFDVAGQWLLEKVDDSSLDYPRGVVVLYLPAAAEDVDQQARLKAVWDLDHEYVMLSYGEESGYEDTSYLKSG